MNLKKPILRPFSWIRTIPQFATIIVLSVLLAILLKPEPLLLSLSYGSGMYLLYSYGSRWFFLQSHRQGIQLANQGQYHEAIAKHAESYAWFSKHQWVDKYRSITLMTPAVFSFTEMALMNAAYCYGQLGDIQNAKAYYQRALDLFPDNDAAKAALNLIENVEQST